MSGPGASGMVTLPYLNRDQDRLTHWPLRDVNNFEQIIL